MNEQQRAEWLGNLEKITKGTRLSDLNTVKLKGFAEKSYGVITGISEKRFYFTRYYKYVSSANKICCSKSEGKYVNRNDGALKPIVFEPLTEGDLEEVSAIVSAVLNQKSPQGIFDGIESAISAIETDKSLPQVWKHQTLAKLYQILEEWQEMKGS
jgi:hypothetical protein